MKRNKILYISLLQILVLLIFACASVEKENYVPFTVSPDGKTITKYTGSSGNVTIPKEINGITITGIGNGAFAIKSYSQYYEINSKIRTVVIPDSITTIGNNAFSGCTSLRFITIPDSVIKIGDGAFSECKNLTSINIPNSVTSIGKNAFYFSGLHSVTIPNSVEVIGDAAFDYCKNLNSVTLTDNITSIGNNVFSRCENLTSVIIPNSVTTIGDSAFSHCDSLTSVTIPNSVVSIGDLAFYGCTNLTSVTISDNLTTIGKYAFSNVPTVYTSHISKPTNWDEAWTSEWDVVRDSPIESSSTVVWNCTLSDTEESYVESVEALYTTKDIEGSISKPYDGVLQPPKRNEHTLIGWTASDGKMIAPESLIYAKTGVYTAIWIEEGISYKVNFESNNDTMVETQTFFGGFKIIEPEEPARSSFTFGGWYKDAELTTPWNFNTDILLEDTTLYAEWLENYIVTFVANGGTNSMKSQTFAHEIPQELNTNNFTAPEGQYFTKWNTKSDGSGTSYANNENFTTNSHVVLYAIWNNPIVDGDYVVTLNGEIVEYTGKTNNVRIPEKIANITITSIGEKAFSHNYYLETILIPSTVISIKENAFQFCSSLRDITIPGNVSTIASGAFFMCSELTNITLEKGIAHIGGSAFESCTALTSVVIPESVTTIGYAAFYECTALTRVSISKGVTHIQGSAFAGCTSLTNIIIPNTVSNIGAFAFDKNTTVYSNAIQKLDGWNSSWHKNEDSYQWEIGANIWACKFSDDINEPQYVISIEKETEYLGKGNYIGTIDGSPSIPYRENYVFIGWITPEGGTITQEELKDAPNVTYSALWIQEN